MYHIMNARKGINFNNLQNQSTAEVNTFKLLSSNEQDWQLTLNS